MFAPGWVVPFDAEPVSSGAAHLADVPNGTERTIVGKALADLKISDGRHVASFLLYDLRTVMEQGNCCDDFLPGYLVPGWWIRKVPPVSQRLSTELHGMSAVLAAASGVRHGTQGSIYTTTSPTQSPTAVLYSYQRHTFTTCFTQFIQSHCA